jgi:DNA-binding GntR family transcriptional regulator
MTEARNRRQADDGRRLAVFVYDEIKQRLLDGVWAAGESVPVESLKTEFRVSKQPVMEALRRLATDDLLEIIPQVGCRVPLYDAEEMADFFALFASLEAESAAIAAARSAPAYLARLAAINAEIGLLADVADPADRARLYRTLNRDFHAGILAMAQSAIVTRTSSRMWDLSDLFINTVSQHSLDVSERHADHEQLIAAFRERDSDTVRATMRAHILRNVPMLEQARSARAG